MCPCRLFVAVALGILCFLFSPVSKTEAREINAVESDYLYLLMKNTTLPGVPEGEDKTRGVFAKHLIKAQDIVCEYRGPVIKPEDKGALDETYAFEVKGPLGEPLVVLVIISYVLAHYTTQTSHTHSHTLTHTHTHTHTHKHT
jgi:hypothetical protein